MRTKHFVNDDAQVVNSALQALKYVNPAVVVDAENKVVYARSRNNQQKSRVSIISGGGAGHEPSFSGFVGEGLLTAAVSGTIFASPNASQILKAIEGVDGSKGILVTVLNYTGDVLNFGVAVEKARARNPRLQIEMLVVGDDVGVPRSRAGKVGRRGISGTVFVHKVTGALAAAGAELDEIAKAGQLVSRNLVSIGVSLDRVHVPGRPVEDELESNLGMQEVELGMGIHNEPGSGRMTGKDVELPNLVEEMLRQLLDPNDHDRGFLQTRGDKMVLLVNNLGALSVLELGAIVNEVVGQLRKSYSIVPVRVYSGTYMTSLDGPGFSVSLLNAVDIGGERDILQLLDAPSEAPGWSAAIKGESWSAKWDDLNRGATASKQGQTTEQSHLRCDMEATIKSLRAGLNAVIAAEPEVTKYDSIVGDGDCGTTLRRGAQAILRSLSKSEPRDIVELLSNIAGSVEATMDGTSGALYAIYTNALTRAFEELSGENDNVDVKLWSQALQQAIAVLEKYTPAKPGDRTVIDALQPFTETLSSTGSLKDATAAAVSGAASTKDMHASLGRTVYVGGEDEWIGKIPDPGAWGLSKFFEGLAQG